MALDKCSQRWYNKNKDKKKAYQANHKEAITKYQAKYRADHKANKAILDKTYYLKNKDKILAYYKSKRLAEPKKVVIKMSKLNVNTVKMAKPLKRNNPNICQMCHCRPKAENKQSCAICIVKRATKRKHDILNNMCTDCSFRKARFNYRTCQECADQRNFRVKVEYIDTPMENLFEDLASEG